MSRCSGWLCVVICALGLSAAPARANVTRYAVVIGNDRGSAGEVGLLYAERDAERVHQVLRELGGFDPVNMVLLRGEGAATLEQTLVSINARIRTQLETPGEQAFLFVYYSGHADGQALELGGTRLDIQRVAELVRGSAATFRVLVLDACRSGALTRSKGGRIAPAFAIENEAVLPGQGMAFLTASAADEDAQESDEISGSYFTHALVSGMLGAADLDADGVVALDEAYTYAYDATLRTTSRSLAGAQHPTFHYDLRGQGKLTLTKPFAQPQQRAQLMFPAGRSYLVMRDDAQGAVVAEVSAHDRGRALSLREGNYYIVGRASDHLLEGRVVLRAGDQHTLDDTQLRRVEYAQLVRKGHNTQRVSHGPFVGYAARSVLRNAHTVCHGPQLGYTLDLSELSLRAWLHGCRSEFERAVVHGTVDELDIGVRALRMFDVGPLALGIGVGVLYGVFRQTFDDSARTTPNRLSNLGGLLVACELELDIGAGFFGMLQVEPTAYWFSLRDMEGNPGLQTHFALRAGFAVGHRF